MGKLFVTVFEKEFPLPRQKQPPHIAVPLALMGGFPA
jgi:hypothetical protein